VGHRNRYGWWPVVLGNAALVAILMAELNEEEQKFLTHLEFMHKQVVAAFGKEYGPEHVRIMKTNGNIPWKVMCAFCDAHETEYPDWPDFVKGEQ